MTYKELPQEIKARVDRWIAALLSGEYKQGRYMLHKIDSNEQNYYCCLGVACNIFKEGLQLNLEQVLSSTWYYYFYNNKSNILPSEVCEYLWLKEDGGFIFTIDSHTKDSIKKIDMSLARLNDQGKSFEEIAEVILTEDIFETNFFEELRMRG